ncbi:MAG: 4Fe-4S dicluster domain-containing protein [Thermodesulfobacteriota bacterium]
MYQGRDELAVMQEDLGRALGRPKHRWAMLIDLRRCTACHACTAACVSEQKSPPGVMYRPVYEQELGKFPKVTRRFTPRLCNQCDDPPCVAACPNKGKATWKDKDGVVMINYAQCIGCGRCVVACPYKARALDGGGFYTAGTPKLQDYEKAPSWEYGNKWAREEDELPVGTARKCHFCVHRLKAGMLPACVTTCPCRANFFGDPEDPQSLIHIWMKQNSSKLRVLSSVKSKGERKPSSSELRGMRAHELAQAIGYPGQEPIFAGQAAAKPRVFYILP